MIGCRLSLAAIPLPELEDVMSLIATAVVVYLLAAFVVGLTRGLKGK